MPRLKLGVIFGGRSQEHEISIISARAIVAESDKSRYEVVPLGVSRGGRWLSPRASERLLASAPKRCALPPWSKTLGEPFRLLRAVDAAFPVIHGENGEDGSLQGLLELAGVPYVGAGVAASALGMDKALQKEEFIRHGLPTPGFVAFLRREWEREPEHCLDAVERELGYPCFVKPANGGSSVGITKAHRRDHLAAGLKEAARYDRKLVVEQAIDGRDIECSVIGNEEAVAATPLGEITPLREFYDYQAKYTDSGTRLTVPADLPPEAAALLRHYAVQAYRAIDCAGMARVDFLVERGSGRVFVSEINTVPGFTPISMYAKLWIAAGINFPALIDWLVKLALERHANRGGAKGGPVPEM